MHFFSPVPVMPLIELIRGDETDDATEDFVRELAAELGKQVIVSRDRPGFIVNRILMPFLAEAMRAYEEGLGTAEDIDTGARVGLNHPMGPLELADFIGLDVCLHIMEVLHEGFGDPRFAPPPVLRRARGRGPPGPEDRARLLHLPAGDQGRASRRLQAWPGETSASRRLDCSACTVAPLASKFSIARTRAISCLGRLAGLQQDLGQLVERLAAQM